MNGALLQRLFGETGEETARPRAEESARSRETPTTLLTRDRRVSPEETYNHASVFRTALLLEDSANAWLRMPRFRLS